MLVAVIPAFNEEKTVGDIVQRTRRYVETVIVVNDGSWDRTSQEATDNGAIVINHDMNYGVGRAIKTGITRALQLKATRILLLDADSQHFPEDIPLFLPETEDVIIGTRFGGFTNLSMYKALLNLVASRLASWLAKTKVVDSESGFRLHNERSIPYLLQFQSDDYGWATEMIIDLAKAGMTFKYIPIQTAWGIPSRPGQSRRGFIYGLKVLWRLIRK